MQGRKCKCLRVTGRGEGDARSVVFTGQDEVMVMQEVYCLRVTGRGESDARSVVFTGHWTR